MRDYRRFELHKGNKEKFWEIKRYDKNLYFREGNIKRKAGEKDPTVKREEKKDFRQAQLSYDKEIQRKLGLGYVEVYNPTEPPEDNATDPTATTTTPKPAKCALGTYSLPCPTESEYKRERLLASAMNNVPYCAPP